MIFTLCETDVLVFFDVTALFIKVPVDIVLDRLKKDASLTDRTKMLPTQIRDFLRTCMKTAHYKCNSLLYSQVEVAAM